ncbi:hypothetical protein [Methylocystis sp. JR02]|uniref:hypothetical protein n=1 Tax=Methylocystis sp. JR02 TaxID=3046284 RepID=UPI0024BBC192|nr:hypothetical protein [Methylocystis sp. JR02]MDJ0450800.1 hypothetical protein [Methylocystis sp. JR02]
MPLSDPAGRFRQETRFGAVPGSFLLEEARHDPLISSDLRDKAHGMSGAFAATKALIAFWSTLKPHMS